MFTLAENTFLKNRKIFVFQDSTYPELTYSVYCGAKFIGHIRQKPDSWWEVETSSGQTFECMTPFEAVTFLYDEARTFLYDETC